MIKFYSNETVGGEWARGDILWHQCPLTRQIWEKLWGNSEKIENYPHHVEHKFYFILSLNGDFTWLSCALLNLKEWTSLKESDQQLHFEIEQLKLKFATAIAHWGRLLLEDLRPISRICYFGIFPIILLSKQFFTQISPNEHFWETTEHLLWVIFNILPKRKVCVLCLVGWICIIVPLF